MTPQKDQKLAVDSSDLSLPKYYSRDDTDPDNVKSAIGPTTYEDGRLIAAKTKIPLRFGKKHLLITGMIVALLLITGVSAAAYNYNRRDRVVADSLLKILSARTSYYSGTISSTASGGGKIDVAYSIASTAAGRSKVEFDAKAIYDKKLYPLGLSVVTDQDKQVFFKLSHIAQLLQQLPDSTRNQYGVSSSASNQINDRWVVIHTGGGTSTSNENGEENAMRCMDQAIKQFAREPKQQKEIHAAYAENSFIVVTDFLGAQNVNGTLSNHYKLKWDDELFGSFMKTLKGTKVFRNLDNCSDGMFATQIDTMTSEPADREVQPKTDVEYDYWVNLLTHEPVKIAIESKTPQTISRYEANVRLNKPLDIELPKPDMSLSEFEAKLKDIVQQDLFQDTKSEPAVNSPTRTEETDHSADGVL